MFAILADNEKSVEIRRRAAAKLLYYKWKSADDLAFNESRWYWSPDQEPPRPHPAIGQFSDPTVAELIIDLRREHLAIHEAVDLKQTYSYKAELERTWTQMPMPRRERWAMQKAVESHAYRWDLIEPSYLDMLRYLRDERCVADISQIFSATKSMKIYLESAEIAAELGGLGPVQKSLRNFAAVS